MGEDRVYLASVRQEVGLPLRAVAVAMTDFSEPPLELLQIAVCRVAELRVGAKAPPNIVKRLLASLGVEAARDGGFTGTIIVGTDLASLRLQAK